MKRSLRYSVPAVFAIGAAALVLAACGGGGGGGGTATAATMGSGSSVVSTKSIGGMKVLVDSHGKTLYGANVEKGGMIRCTGSCTSIWMSLHASAKQAKAASTQLKLKLAVIKRPAGGNQLTFRGRPLYTFAPEGAGQLTGNGVSDQFQGTHFHWSAATTTGGSASGGSSSSSNGSGYSSAY